MTRILIVKPSSLGDIVHTLPLAHALKRGLPTEASSNPKDYNRYLMITSSIGIKPQIISSCDFILRNFSDFIFFMIKIDGIVIFNCKIF